LFGWPVLPPQSSDHALVAGLTAGVLLLVLETSLKWTWWWRALARALVWTSLAWSLYPAWLAQEGGLLRRSLVTGGMGVAISAWALVSEAVMRATASDPRRTLSITPAALIPPTVALSVLLQLGGSMQFAQSTGALASAVAAVCVILIWKPRNSPLRPMASLWGMFFGLLAWSGWLFAEVHVAAVIVLLAAPPAALSAQLLPRRQEAWVTQLQEAAISAVVAGVALWMGWVHYRSAGDSLGY
jgi:hypothetical protein